MSTQSTSSGERYRSIVDRLEPQVRECIPAFPQIKGNLFHYTSANGLIGIISTSTLWATDSQYLNDPAEFRYGATLVANCLANVSKGLDNRMSAVTTELAEMIVNHADGWYVSSFCDSEDRLDQWRSYADQGGGYCLEFDGEAVQLWAEQHRCRLIDVEYDQSKQIQRLESHLKLTLEVLQRDLEADPEPPMEWHMAAHIQLRTVVLPLILLSKHPSFKSEGERRLVYRLGSAGIQNERRLLSHRSGHGFVVPYLPMAISRPQNGTADSGVAVAKSHPNTATLPISSVRCGPTTHRELGKSGVVNLLKRYGYHSVDVTVSVVPYRG